MFTIRFILQDLKVAVVSSVKKGQTILEVALNNKINVDHDCGGICSCSTCHIYVTKGNHFIEGKSRKEEHYIDRLNNANENSRLACQCLLLNGKGDIEVVIPAKA